MGSIEEDINELKHIMIMKTDCGFAYSQKNTVLLQKAIENVLNEFTRQKQINEEHQKINGELREKVKELEEENKENKKKYLALLIGQFPDTTETYKKYKKELQKLLQESEDK